MRATLHPASAPLAGLLLVLTAIVAIGSGPVGLPLGVVWRSAYPRGVLCVEQRLVVIRVGPEGKLFINSEPVTRETLAPRLEEIFAARTEGVAFVQGAPGLTFAEVADVIAAVRPIAWNVGLLTPSAIPTTDEPLLRGAFPVKQHWDYDAH